MMRRASRREFLKHSVAAGMGLWAIGQLPCVRGKSSTDRLNFACIGVGGKGSSDTDHVGLLGNVVALCDIDDHFLEAKAARFPKARKYHDFRRLLEEMDKQIDAVTISTPDHTHAAAAALAMKRGKHVYCQKPLTHSVHEARVLRELAARQKVATQMGNQGTATDGVREAVEVIRSGVLGAIREVHVWTNRPRWPQAPEVVARPRGSQPVPAHVHWDLWLGPAPERPYHHGPARNGHGTYHDFNWRGWWDFGTGALGDMGCHTANLAFLALGLDHPQRIAAESGELNAETYPAWAIVRYEFPGRGARPAVRLTWYEGRRHEQRVLPLSHLFQGGKPSDSGCLLVGDQGMLYSPSDYGSVYKLLPEKAFRDYRPPKPLLPRNGLGDLGMKMEWVKAIRGGPPAMSDFAYAGLLTEAILLGNVAIRAQVPLDWDGPNLRVTNMPDANIFLRRDYRPGWSL